jgi:hypothetical protein
LAVADCDVHRARSAVPVLTVSSKNGAGIGGWLQFLDAARAARRKYPAGSERESGKI